ncbi:glycosyltransferase [Stygiobacter electus]|uniref:Glycosyltransferase n=1 Tax=Stygiobacter electus TaxID=3032292 RepID=A0AAE3NYM1_9BACT|nr:glycosyltransferase [Stygiobacter electus]MDF1612456.1 glycosyltransferase [Stygiobacter electus]
MININDYEKIVGKNTLIELYTLAEKLKGKTIQNINSTSVGGGVAEILSKMVPFLKQLGLNADWNVIKGDGKFFEITKKIHNALHGRKENITKEDLEYFVEINRNNISNLDLSSDIMFIHDPQPIGLIEKRKDYNNNWIWRCHIDITSAQEDIYNFFKTYILQYDSCVFSAPSFSRKDLNLPQILISPSIDPLSDKNKELTEQEITKIFEKYGLDLSRPIVTQISRFDYLKDPIGVIKAYKMARKYNDCQLILAGGGATDDPEGIKVYEEVLKEANDDSDIHILLLPQDDLTINALVRGSTIILQKSIKEGFGLTVSEALWKEKPVIASAVGGIPLQITHKYSGILTYSIEGTAYYLKQLLNDPEYAKQLAKNGKEHVKNNFLITRHLREYLLLFLSMYYKEDVIYF